MVQDNFAELIDYNLKDKDNREENSVLYVFTVSELNVSIKHYLESNPEYRKLSVKGEISNFKLSPSGHYYFT